MAFGNGSHSLKRGFLRPNGGSRLPAFLIIGLLAGCSLLLYNVYSTTVERNSLAEELGLLRKKWQACQKDKTGKKFLFLDIRGFTVMNLCYFRTGNSIRDACPDVQDGQR